MRTPLAVAHGPPGVDRGDAGAHSGPPGDHEKGRGVPVTGIENARPETAAIGDTLEQMRAELPFDPLEFIDFTLPKEFRATLRTDGVD
jgi:hypothetical protein